MKLEDALNRLRRLPPDMPHSKLREEFAELCGRVGADEGEWILEIMEDALRQRLTQEIRDNSQEGIFDDIQFPFELPSGSIFGGDDVLF